MPDALEFAGPYPRNYPHKRCLDHWVQTRRRGIPTVQQKKTGVDSIPMSPATVHLLAYEQMAKSFAPKQAKRRNRIRRLTDSLTRSTPSG